VVDPELNAVACAAAPRHARSSDRQARRSRTIATAVEQGPDALSDRQKLVVLTDPVMLARLHVEVWTSSAAHPAWRTARAPAVVGQHAALGVAS
jgi:membrane glycosyltransferase